MKKSLILRTLLCLLIFAAFTYWFMHRQSPTTMPIQHTSLATPRSTSDPQPQTTPTPASSPNQAPTPESPIPSPSPTSTPTPTPAPTPAGLVVVGTVTERESGIPLRDVSVAFIDAKTSPPLATLTSPGGTYELAGLPDRLNYRLEASREGYAATVVIADAARPGPTRADFALEKAGNVLVSVTDAQGRPLPSATVSVENALRTLPPRQTETGPDGTVMVENISRANPPKISAFLPDRDGETASARPRFGESMNTRLELRLALSTDEAPRVFTGTVTGPEGQPLPGVTVTLAESVAIANPLATTTGADGRYRLEPASTRPNWNIWAWGKGWGSQHKHAVLPIEPTAHVVTDFQLAKEFSYFGRVVDRDNKPVAGAVVESGVGTIMSMNMLSVVKVTRFAVAPLATRETLSGADGSFRFDGVADSSIRVTATKPGYSTGSAKALPNQKVEVRLAPNTTLRGKVTAAGSGEPVREFTMLLKLTERGWDPSIEPEERSFTFTSPGGEFEIAGLNANDPHFLVVAAKDHASASVHVPKSTLAAEPAGEIAVELVPERNLVFRFIDERTREPIHAVAVSTQIAMNDSSTNRLLFRTPGPLLFTGRDGIVEIKDATPAIDIDAAAPGYPRLSILASDRAKYANGENRFTVPMPRGSKIAGYVYFNGAPAANARIHLSQRESSRSRMGGFSRDSQTGSDGFYEFESVPAGDYGLTANYNSITQGLHQLQKDFSIKPGEDLRINIGDDLGNSALYGLITAPGNGSLPKLNILLIPEDRTHYFAFGALAAPDGSYKIIGLRDGKYRLHVFDPNASNLKIPGGQVLVEVKALTAYDIELVSSER